MTKFGNRVLKLRQEMAQFLVADRTGVLSGKAVGPHDDRALTPVLHIARTNVECPDEAIGVELHTHRQAGELVSNLTGAEQVRLAPNSYGRRSKQARLAPNMYGSQRSQYTTATLRRQG